MIMQQRIIARLTAALDPVLLDIVDESPIFMRDMRARAKAGTHDRVRAVSARSSTAVAALSGTVSSMTC